MAHSILIKEICYSDFTKIDGQPFTGNSFFDLIYSIIQSIKMLMVQINLLRKKMRATYTTVWSAPIRKVSPFGKPAMPSVLLNPWPPAISGLK